MTPDSIQFSAGEFDAVFPFHVGFDALLVISHVGRSMRRLTARASVGAPLAEVLRPHRPAEPFDFAQLSNVGGQIYTVREPVSGTLLRGQMQRLGPHIFFLGSPWIGETATLGTLGLTMNDFAAHDPTLDLLMVLEIQKLASADLQMLTQRLEKSEVMLRGLFEALPMGVVIRDEQGALEFSNGFMAREGGVESPGSAGGAQDPEWKRRDAEAVRAVLATGQSVDYEIASVVGGVERWFHCIKFVVPAVAGSGRRVGSLTREITRQKQLELEAQNVSEQRLKFVAMQREFISMVSHEFRTPLTSIEGTHYLLQKLLKDSGVLYGPVAAKANKWFGLQAAGLVSLRELVDKVLVLNRIEHLTSGASLPVIAPAEMLVETVAAFNEAAAAIRVILSNDLPADFTASMDRGLVKAAVENLISNGLKYSPPERVVQVHVSAEPQGWAVTVSDEGRGIPPKDQENLFRPFFRASNVGVVSGTGLGLAIVKRAVDFHGGRVDYESKLGEGTRFTLHFPAAATPQAVNSLPAYGPVFQNKSRS